jgi:hypothetical protein
MEFHRQPRCPRDLEHPGCLFRRERNVFAERIDCVRELAASDRRHHGAHLVDIPLFVTIRFWRQCVRREKARAHLNFPFLGEPARRTKHPLLCFSIEAITRLDFDSGNALREQTVETRQRCPYEIVFARRASCADCR